MAPQSAAMTLMDAINLGVSVAAIIIGFGAVFLSVYFFVQSKDTESNTAQLLGEIKQQTQSLEKLSGKLLSQMTAAVTGPRAADELSLAIIQKVFPAGPPSTQAVIEEHESDTETDPRALIDYKILTFYHAGVANLASQTQLPDMSVTSDGDTIRAIIDRSSNDYHVLKSELASQEISTNASYFKPSYEYAVELEALIKDAVAVWRDRATPPEVGGVDPTQ